MHLQRVILCAAACLALASCELLGLTDDDAGYPYFDAGADAAADTGAGGADAGATDGGGLPDAVVGEPQTASAVVSAAEGGAVALADGTTLTVPAGALAADTELTVTRVGDPSSSPAGLAGLVQLEPAGTTFLTPVTLHVPVDAARIPAGQVVGAIMASTLHEPRSVGSETSVWQPAPFEPVGDGYDVTIEHFSVVAIAYHPDHFIVPVIPGRYLRAGDVIYTATGAGDFFEGGLWPTHAALFAADDVEKPVIESTIGDANCGTVDGVQRSPYYDPVSAHDTVSLCGQHLLIGLRRPPGATKEQGVAAAATAAGYIGGGYGVTGLPLVGGFTCVMLVEQSWEGGGVNLSWTPDQLLTPWNQMVNTEPIRDIDVPWTDGEIRIPVAVSHAASWNAYTALGRIPGSSATLTVSPTQLQLDGRVRIEQNTTSAHFLSDIVLQLEPEDAGTTIDLSLRVQSPDIGFDELVTRFLRVHVVGPESQPGDGIPCLGTGEMLGPFVGATEPGGAFSYDIGENTTARVEELDDGRVFLNLDTGLAVPGITLRAELPELPRDGGSYVLAHPLRQPDEPGRWWIRCPLDDGREFTFTRFDQFYGTVTFGMRAECREMLVDVAFDVTDYDPDTEEWVQCSFSGRFEGAYWELDP